jgi:hypothetical protein
MKYRLERFMSWIPDGMRGGIPDWHHFWTDGNKCLSWPSESDEIDIEMLKEVIEVFS